jgi:hypothetical protein
MWNEMVRWRRRANLCLVVYLAALALAMGAATAQAQSNTPPTGAPSSAGAAPTQQPSQPAIDPYHELETKYLFGFTSGADIGAQGEKSIEFETTAAAQMRHGTYRMIEQEVEFEGVPTQNFAYELSAHGTYNSIRGVDGLDDINRSQFSGLSADLRYLIIGRGPGCPIGLTFAMEPEWSRIDGTSGLRSKGFANALTLIADTELIPNRLYAAVNVSYEPEVDKAPGQKGWERESSVGITGGLAYRVAPKVTLGGEVQYYRDYDGVFLNGFGGHALFVGPTMHIQFTGKTMLSLAFSTQVYGRATGEDHNLDLTNFQRYIANAKLEFEF